MKKREKICFWLFKMSEKPYRFLFKRNTKSWPITLQELMKFPANSFGFAYQKFLRSNGFELLAKLENHDGFHVLLNHPTAVKNEIGLQFLLFGNGKRSIYCYLTMILGFCMVPEYFNHFKKMYQKGKAMFRIHDINFLNHLQDDLKEMRIKYHIQLIN